MNGLFTAVTAGQKVQNITKFMALPLQAWSSYALTYFINERNIFKIF
jgi:hypothetical protein